MNMKHKHLRRTWVKGGRWRLSLFLFRFGDLSLNLNVWQGQTETKASIYRTQESGHIYDYFEIQNEFIQPKHLELTIHEFRKPSNQSSSKIPSVGNRI